MQKVNSASSYLNIYVIYASFRHLSLGVQHGKVRKCIVYVVFIACSSMY